mmetsp:Transcript_5887/g.7128  ORF Transcript_5887/g.7128 Transcript_5887/m.7128 type:complete len:93 (+) Transcript_5887:812-1090(+)|eukprot:CAMPEP_0170455588 /NCGR_PEP_ID=MMETSP0123-20130129/3504_1 /TAXON_ID=182087 /ORGANISM="Favella ehrenbergii, Strain Fehren 1" /LENGTH=92 /DNA_ID=CAMNT_0010718779 /DNA_START=733 /DNA_END=1011 /DNA_ORIENTATION=+
MATFTKGSYIEVLLAQDSGNVTLLSFESEDTLKVAHTSTVHQFREESALSLAFDFAKLPGSDTWTTFLAIGSNSRVLVFERVEEAGAQGVFN